MFVLLMFAAGVVVLVFSGLTAWEGSRLRPSSLLLSVGGWALVVAAMLGAVDHL